MSKIHMWKRMSMLGLVVVQCGRKVKSTQFTSNAEDVTCAACLNKIAEGAKK